MLRMTDDIDRANHTAQFTNDLAIQQYLIEHELPPQQIVAGIVECRDCDVEIPAERLTALPNCVRCIECQIAYEKGLKNGI